MGKPIVYCEVCGKSISAESILLQDAILVQSSYYCRECADNLNIRVSDKGKKTFKKLLRKKVDINELPDISIPKVSEQETFFTRHKKELTYFLYSFSIFIIIFSALFIIYKYALSKPSIKDLSVEKCKQIKQLIEKSSFDKNKKSDFISVIDAISSVEDIIKGSDCEKEVLQQKSIAQARISYIEDQEKFIEKLQAMENNPNPEEAILQMDDLYNEYSQKPVWTEVKTRFQDTAELVINKLWQSKKKEIESEYIASDYPFDYYLTKIKKFSKDYLENNRYILIKQPDFLRTDIARFKDALQEKFKKDAEEYNLSLTRRILDLIKDKKCDDAKKEVLNFPIKYVGTSAYSNRDKTMQNIENNCIQDRTEELPQKQNENSNKQGEDDIPAEIHLSQRNTKELEKSDIDVQKKMEQIKNNDNQSKEEKNFQQDSKKYKLFNGKDKNGWVETNKNANWRVWYGSLYGSLPIHDKGSSIIYFSKKSFKNFSLSFKYRLISGYFFVCFRMSPDKPSEQFSFMFLNNYNRTDDYVEFSSKVFNDVVLVKSQKGGDGSANLNKDIEEGFIGFMISNGSEVYFKDIEVEEITETENDLKKSITVPLFNGKDLGKWIKSGAQAKWEVVENTIFAENSLEKSDSSTIDMSTLSVMYFDDRKFQPDWTNYTVSFEFNIVEDGFIVFGKFPTEGSAKGTFISTNKGLFTQNNWYRGEVTVTSEKIVVNFPGQDIASVEEKIDNKLKGFFGFGILPKQKVYLRNVKLRFIE